MMRLFHSCLQVVLCCFLSCIPVTGQGIDRTNRLNFNTGTSQVKPMEPRMPNFGGNSTNTGHKFIRLSNGSSEQDPFASVTKTTACGTTYVLEDGHMAMIYSRSDYYSYTCDNTFKAAGDSSLLIMECPNFRLRFTCYFESLKISAGGKEHEYCGKDEVPRISSKEISLYYKRVLMGFNGGYNCLMIAKGPSVQPMNALTEPRCGVTLNTKASLNEHRIVGGTNAKMRHPWMVHLKMTVGKYNYEYRCGGTLVTNKHIVSAAHCFYGYDIRTVDVALGKNDLSVANEQGSVWRRTSTYKVHESYDDSLLLHDIAIVTIPEPVTYSDLILPICLPPADLKIQGGEESVAIGWGATSYGGQEALVLQEVNLTVQSNSQCQSDWRKKFGDLYFEIFDSQLCTKNAGKDTCSGDSGGPLLYKVNGTWTLIGITSFGYRCADPDVGGVYTRVSKYINWIKTNTQ
ncbi:trypsin-1-like [Macrobrachium rosenbergii]|uniref:trypsin-1-like n=1 Tax=Macrobrachium rosenbergii TaxID=79674 RepID=UPI0034D5FCD3